MFLECVNGQDMNKNVRNDQHGQNANRVSGCSVGSHLCNWTFLFLTLAYKHLIMNKQLPQDHANVKGKKKKRKKNIH